MKTYVPGTSYLYSSTGEAEGFGEDKEGDRGNILGEKYCGERYGELRDKTCGVRASTVLSSRVSTSFRGLERPVSNDDLSLPTALLSGSPKDTMHWLGIETECKPVPDEEPKGRMGVAVGQGGDPG